MTPITDKEMQLAWARCRPVRFPWVPYDAITIGRYIFYDIGRMSSRLLSHELAHVVQWQRYGLWFPLRYLWGWIRAGFRYTMIDLEQQARRHEDYI